MSESIIKNIVETYLQDNWNLCDISWDNIRYNPIRGKPFINVFISQNDSRPITAFCTRKTYTILIEVKVKKNSGTTLADSYCDMLEDLFKGYSSGNFRVLSSTIQRVGGSNEWYQKNVVINCKYTEF